MIIRNNTDPKIEGYKRKMGLTGDVYMVGHFIESLESHKRLIPHSTATTIEEAETERETYEAEQEQARMLAAANAETGDDTEEGEV